MRGFDRIPLAHLPTPLEPLPALSARFKARLHIKRDDCTGLAFGGNKARKLEYVLAHALAGGHDVLVTSGAIQSNHARQTAAAAARLGLACHVVLSNPIASTHPNWLRSGNAMLDDMFGARIEVVEEAESDAAIERIMAAESALGRKPYLVPVGASSAIGSLGYVACARELLLQFGVQGLDVSHIVVATGSAGTHGGLLHGLREAGSDITVVGISVGEPAPAKRAKVANICRGLADLKCKDSPVADHDIVVFDDYAGRGYAHATAEARDAMLQLARAEGIVVDPVYTAKALAGLFDLVARDEAYRSRDVVFLHTGGTPALFACPEWLRPEVSK